MRVLIAFFFLPTLSSAVTRIQNCFLNGQAPRNAQMCPEAVKGVLSSVDRAGAIACTSCLNFCNVGGIMRYRGCGAGLSPASVGCTETSAVTGCLLSDDPSYVPTEQAQGTDTDPGTEMAQGGDDPMNQGQGTIQQPVQRGPGPFDHFGQVPTGGARGSRSRNSRSGRGFTTPFRPATSAAQGTGRSSTSFANGGFTVTVTRLPGSSTTSTTTSSTNTQGTFTTQQAGGPTGGPGTLGRLSGNTAQSTHTQAGYVPPANAFIERPKNPGAANFDAVLGNSGSGMMATGLGLVVAMAMVFF